MKYCILLAMAVATTGCATKGASSGDDGALLSMLGGRAPHTELSSLERAEVLRHPLGSEKNPVRVEMPTGERAYIQRLRCADGKAPTFEREGSVGSSPYGSIMDIYSLECTAQPIRQIYLDMYHRGHIEAEPIDGFSIVAADGT